ncbi:MAG: hypothetical protein A2798_02100 [Candidatus Levybacteria bacterium RIFCSPHIGHO2_01_FULL_37_17]|nr:MAG: hypothetical protein A2798_02100 [Candidatus Levybacteria bacterium RIFCSPHIGHO2_01_FULL_37_17]OGH36671.1 MAG: hypothetical protein A2959_00090 [Candidatus Levybacteria bacterium RIFCSPLOWO2_01_FULL_38_23]
MLENSTNRKKIDIGVISLKGWKQKTIGATGSGLSKAILFETRFGIHTFFVATPIDVIILDTTGKVVKIKKDLPPNRLFLWNPKFSYIIEAPSGTIRKLDLKIGNILRFSL